MKNEYPDKPWLSCLGRSSGSCMMKHSSRDCKELIFGGKCSAINWKKQNEIQSHPPGQALVDSGG